MNHDDNSIPTSSLLYLSDPTHSHASLFEMMVRLLFRSELPSVLPFIQRVARHDPDASRAPSSWYERASAAGFPALTKPTVASMPMPQLDVRASLIESAGYPIVALRYLLARPLSCEAHLRRVLLLLRAHANHDLTHTVIFNLILTHLLPMVSNAPPSLVPDINLICAEICASAPSVLTASQMLQQLSEARSNWQLDSSKSLRPLQLSPFKKLFLSKLQNSS